MAQLEHIEAIEKRLWSAADQLRAKLVETGDVDLMISIRSNFFYTRTVPCAISTWN